MAGEFAAVRVATKGQKHMSIATLKLELESRRGRELLPNCFPIDLLIQFTRQLALVAEGSLSTHELPLLAGLLQDYFRRIMEMQGKTRLEDFDSRSDELRPMFVQELYDFMRDEIVSSLIGHDISKLGLRERLLAVLDEAEATL